MSFDFKTATPDTSINSSAFMFGADSQSSATPSIYQMSVVQTLMWTSPILVTPSLGVATGTSLAIGGATLGGNALAVTGTSLFNSAVTLGAQQTTQGSIVLANTAAGAFSTTIQSSNSATEAWTFTLPVSKGTNGYILTTNGSGVTSWSNPTSLGIDIDVNSTAIASGTSGRLVYDNAGTFGEISAITTNGTAALTLGLQQTTQGSLVLGNTAAGAFSTTLKSSNSATEAWTLTLPVSKGSNGYILTTDGTGTSSWTNPTALGIDIDVNSTAITSGTSGRIVYDNAGTFGEISAITTNGSNTLTIGTQQSSQGSLVLANTAAGAFSTTVQASNSASAAWTFTLPATGGTNNYVLTTNGSGTSSWSQVSLTAGVTGVLPVANGGTGQSTNTVHGVLIGNAANAINATAAGSSGQILQSGGASADPTWTTATFPSTATSTGTILRADGTNWAATTATYPTTTTAGTILVSATNNAVTGTSSPTIGVQQTTQGSIILANTAAGAFATTIQSSNSASAAWTLTLPTTAGTNNYALTTNGSGVSSWSQISLTAGVTETLPVTNGGTGTSTAFTAGSIVYAGASGVYSQNNSGLFWDNTNGRLGIGTASPNNKLSIQNGTAILFNSDEVSDTIIFFNQKNGANFPQSWIGMPTWDKTAFKIYAPTATSSEIAANYSSAVWTFYTGGAVALTLSSTKSVVCNNAAISTSATDGFLYIPSCAGTPTGVPTTYTGRIPLVYDSTNNKLYVYNGGWKSATYA